jgi:hypothetical protein
MVTGTIKKGGSLGITRASPEFFKGNNLKCEFKKFGFQHREDGMKVETEERSVVEAT